MFYLFIYLFPSCKTIKKIVFVQLPQVFSCISRALNRNNALSLPKMQKICDDAYRTKSVISHTVLTNNLDWYGWVTPHCVPKSLMASGLLKVSSDCFQIVYLLFYKNNFRVLFV